MDDTEIKFVQISPMPGNKRTVMSPVLSPENVPISISPSSFPGLKPQTKKSTTKMFSSSPSSRASSPGCSSRAESPSPADSPARANSPYISRYGVSRGREPTFGIGSRFNSGDKDNWDMIYDLPGSLNTTNGSKFSKSKLYDIEMKLPTINTSIYETESGYAMSSDFIRHASCKFSAAPRKGPELDTPSPGNVYQTDGHFTRGSDTSIKVSFNCDQRPPLHYDTITSNVEYMPLDLPKGVSMTLGKKLPGRKPVTVTPGAIYDVHKTRTFKTGPSYSFGGGSRFKN